MVLIRCGPRSRSCASPPRRQRSPSVLTCDDGDQEHEQHQDDPAIQSDPPTSTSPSSLILIDCETQTLTAPNGNPSGTVIRLRLEHDGSCVTILRDRNLSIIQQDAEL